MTEMNVEIVRDGLVQCETSVKLPLDIVQIVAQEEREGFRWLNTYLVFTSQPYEQPKLEDIVKGHAKKVPKPMKAMAKTKAMKSMKAMSKRGNHGKPGPKPKAMKSMKAMSKRGNHGKPGPKAMKSMKAMSNKCGNHGKPGPKAMKSMKAMKTMK
ncbi:unnamed protein product [Symbiodinium sp. CCMP2592]|nr:unnamed protein product [Symbiodinium sp. CCMP2592]